MRYREVARGSPVSGSVAVAAPRRCAAPPSLLALRGVLGRIVRYWRRAGRVPATPRGPPRPSGSPHQSHQSTLYDFRRRVSHIPDVIRDRTRTMMTGGAPVTR